MQKQKFEYLKVGDEVVFVKSTNSGKTNIIESGIVKSINNVKQEINVISSNYFDELKIKFKTSGGSISFTDITDIIDITAFGFVSSDVSYYLLNLKYDSDLEIYNNIYNKTRNQTRIQIIKNELDIKSEKLGSNKLKALQKILSECDDSPLIMKILERQ